MKSQFFRRRSALLALPLAVLFSTVMTTGAHAAGCSLSTVQRLTNLYNKPSHLTILAHRGLWGTSQSSENLVPENSTGAIAYATDACVDAVELDVKMTYDGAPVLMHDYNLGRTTNVYTLSSSTGKYNPDTNTGYNPTVSSLSLYDVRSLKLLLPNRSAESVYTVPVVADTLKWYLGLSSPPPIVFDVKTAAAVRALNTIGIQVNKEPGNFISMKVNASLYQTRAAFTADSPYIRGIPIFVTNNLNQFNVDQALSAWIYGSTDAIEINVKSVGGYLQNELSSTQRKGNPTGVFNALPDYPGSSTKFYNNNGSCCYTLADKYVGGETSDQRGNFEYLNQQHFSFITTDSPLWLRAWMISEGRTD